MHRDASRAFFIGVAAYVAVACSGRFVPVDNAADASTPIVSDGAPPAPDTVPSLDAGDATKPGVGCASAPAGAFCVDFEAPGSLEKPLWTSVEGIGTGNRVILTTGNVFSGQHAATFEKDGQEACTFLRLVRSFPGRHTSFSARADVYTESNGYFLSIYSMVAANLSYNFLVRSTENEVFLTVQKYDGSSFSTAVEKAIPLDQKGYRQWLTIGIDFSRSGTLPEAIFSVGGKRELVALPSDFGVRDPSLRIGPYCVGSPTRLTVDNVFFDGKLE